MATTELSIGFEHNYLLKSTIMLTKNL